MTARVLFKKSLSLSPKIFRVRILGKVMIWVLQILVFHPLR